MTRWAPEKPPGSSIPIATPQPTIVRRGRQAHPKSQELRRIATTDAFWRCDCHQVSP
jgi:hypothetical protein